MSYQREPSPREERLMDEINGRDLRIAALEEVVRAADGMRRWWTPSRRGHGARDHAANCAVQDYDCKRAALGDTK